MADEQNAKQRLLQFERRELRSVEALAIRSEYGRIKPEWHDFEFRRRAPQGPPDVLSKSLCGYDVYFSLPD
jgi:hypothetical protein